MGTGNWLWSIATRNRRDSGGASRDRTDDLLHAMQALSQLSYSPGYPCGLGSAKRGGKVREAFSSVKTKLGHYAASAGAHTGKSGVQAVQTTCFTKQIKRDIDSRRGGPARHGHAQGLRHESHL